MFIIIIKILLFINNNDHHCDNNNKNKTKNKLRPQYLLLAAVVAGEAFVVVLPIAPYHCMSHWQHMQQVLTLLGAFHNLFFCIPRLAQTGGISNSQTCPDLGVGSEVLPRLNPRLN